MRILIWKWSTSWNRSSDGLNLYQQWERKNTTTAPNLDSNFGNWSNIFQDRIGPISTSSAGFPPVTRTPVSVSEFQPPYFPPPFTQEQVFGSLPASLSSLQTSLPSLPTTVTHLTLPPADPYQVTTTLQSFQTNQQRRLTQDSSSPLSLVSIQKPVF